MRLRLKLVPIGLLVIIVGVGVVLAQGDGPSMPFRQLHQAVIINADLWSDTPEMLSAGYGFDNIIGVEGDEAEVRAAGGTWNTVSCADPARNVLTSSATPDMVENAYDNRVEFGDGLPVVFSWPILPTTLNHTDFLVTLNTGETLTPEAASIFPNFEYNERHVAVIFADFGNRLLPNEEGTRYPIKVEVVADDTPLMLVGPAGLVSAVGLFKESDSTPYESGPYLVGAKLNRIDPVRDAGEDAPRLFAGNLPNDGLALYGEAAQYRLRIFTSGGFSPDGVRGVLPTEFARYFRLHAQTASGETILLTATGVDYEIDGGRVQVVGLADLGLPADQDAYDECYVEDHDNYIDIILSGDEAAVRQITHVEIPAGEEGYTPFYNPGGPGNNPSPDVRYTAPGPADLEPVIIALDDPLTVTYQE